MKSITELRKFPKRARKHIRMQAESICIHGLLYARAALFLQLISVGELNTETAQQTIKCSSMP